jgi:cellobiose-specific phosphotransferase system component IIB
MDESTSRIATIVELLVRIPGLILSNDSIVLHILGCDDKEQIDVEALSSALIDASINIYRVDLYLIGPHMKPHNAASTKTSNIIVEASSINGLYHEVNLEILPPPHVVCIFNGGLWGYDSWVPTLQLLRTRKQVYFAVTSYTIQEAEDDFDTLAVNFGDDIEYLWEPEHNPFASTVALTRQTQPDNRPYFDNFAWQCFKI